MTLGVFLGALALLWLLGDGGDRRRARLVGADQVFTFPLNSTKSTVSVRSRWKRGHMTPQDDEVELTLEGSCATAHLYAYLSTGWDHGALDTASVILGDPLHPSVGPAPRVVRHDPKSAIVVSRGSGRGVLVLRVARRDFDALLVTWQSKGACNATDRGRAARELGRLFDTFKVHAGGTARSPRGKMGTI